MDFKILLEKTIKNKELQKRVWDFINSDKNKKYFITVQDNYDLFSDEVKVICSDNDIGVDNIDIKKLYDKFDDEN